MQFQIIDQQTWARKEYFDHYFSSVPCTYSMNVRLDITAILESGVKLYPAMLYAISTIVNRHHEFRTCQNENHEVGIFSEMMPCYTVFHKESETFSNLWTPYHPCFGEFLRQYQQDLQQYGNILKMEAKPDTPINTFPVSMVPWTTFEGFNLNLQKGFEYLLPIFTMGKYYQEQERHWLPLAIQVHHAVCDGFHVSRFVSELQDLINQKDVFA